VESFSLKTKNLADLKRKIFVFKEDEKNIKGLNFS
jgi:hypothetical protein